MLISSKKCLKCGRSPSTHPGTKLFYYPKPGNTNYLKCELWAKYCFSGDESSSQDFQHKLFKERRVLCDKHFKRTSFIDHPDGTTKLIAYAVPVSDDECLDEQPVRNMKDISVDEKDLDPYHVTIKQEKDETDFNPHLVTIKKEPDDPESSNYVNDEDLDIKPEIIKCEIKEEAFADSSSNELPPETSIDTDSQGIESNSHYLYVYKKIHAGVEPFSCMVCDKRFTTVRDLEKHKQTHIGTLSCNLCDKTFTTFHSLKMHKRKHKELNTCDVCHKKFNCPSRQLAHSRTHTGYKPFSCDVCNKSFSLIGNLRSHKRTHTEERPYSCDICDKTFRRSNVLKAHMRSHNTHYVSNIDNRQNIVNNV